MDLIIIENVQTILQGNVTINTLCPVDVKQMPYALGGAVIPGQEIISLGETIIYEGIGHIFTVEKSHEEKQQVNTPFLMGIARKPHEQLTINKKQTVDELYQDLLRSHSPGFCIVGKAVFNRLNVAYLKRSPIYRENVNALHEKYWCREELKNIEADLFGVVLSKPDPRGFYNNPNEKEKAVFSHTHALTPLARHLLADSEILSAELWIETIWSFH